MSLLKFENKINLTVLCAGIAFMANLDARITSAERTLDTRAVSGINNVTQLAQNTTDISGLKLEVSNFKEMIKQMNDNIQRIADRIYDEKKQPRG